MLKNTDIISFIEEIEKHKEEQDPLLLLEIFLRNRIGISDVSAIENPFSPEKRIIHNEKIKEISNKWISAADKNPGITKTFEMIKMNSGISFWGLIYEDNKTEDENYNRFIELSHDVGYKKNLSVIASGFNKNDFIINYLGLTNGIESAIRSDATINKLKFISTVVYEKKFKDIDTHRADAARSFMSEKEIETMQWLANGYRPSQIAEKMRISDWTVREYLTSSARKLNANTLHQAVARAIAWSIVTIK